MAVFASTDKMYEVLGSLFNLLMEDKGLLDKYLESNIVIKFTISDPEGFIWLTNDGKVICGPADYKPTIEMTLSGDTCHIGVTPAPASTRAASATKLSPRKRGSRPTRTRCGFGSIFTYAAIPAAASRRSVQRQLVRHNRPPSRSAKFDRCRHPFLHTRQKRRRKVHPATPGPDRQVPLRSLKQPRQRAAS